MPISREVTFTECQPLSDAAVLVQERQSAWVVKSDRVITEQMVDEI